MTTNVPRAARIPPRSAEPYPGSGTSTTRTPSRRAKAPEPSVEPLSTTMISPSTVAVSRYRRAFATQRSSVSASSRQGITIDSSTRTSARHPFPTVRIFGREHANPSGEPPAGRRYHRRMATRARSEGTLQVTADPAANRLLNTDPLALLIGMLLDQQVPLEWAFMGPANLKARLGHLDAARIAAMDPEALVAVFCAKPAL